jgi:hypothetical protein
VRDLFPGWIPPDEEILDRYWSEATFAVDTSVLLDLYRFSEEAREGLLKALRSFEERLWIPHQVALEFHRNRLAVLLDQREAENNLLRELDQIRLDLDKQLSQLLRGAGRRDLAPLRDAINGGFDSLREKLREAEKEHTKGLGESIRDDPIYEEIVELCTNRVGEPFDEKRQAAVVKNAEERFRLKTPPGYLDDGKDEDVKYGDVILWHQLCERASETQRPVVLIADDQKADWVWEVRGKTIGPRPELVAELNEKAAVGFHLYTPMRLLQVWEQREEGRQVEPEVLAEFEAPTEDPVPSTEPGLFARIAEAFRESLKEEEQKAKLAGEPGHQLTATAFHRIANDGVELALEYQSLMHFSTPPTSLVAVRTPQGQVVRTQMYPLGVSPSGLGDRYTYRVRYPKQFNQEELTPGDYEVDWELFFPGTAQAIPQRVAGDRFTIPDVNS